MGGKPNPWSVGRQTSIRKFEYLSVTDAVGPLEIVAADGTHVVKFGYGGSGPWNPLVQPGQEVVEVPAASGGATFDTRLVWGAVLLALGTTFVAIRRRKRQAAEPG